jgi:hypothetical protein
MLPLHWEQPKPYSFGEFLYADSSTQSNFTVFAFHEQEPNSANQQTDFLICHLVQEQGQKKSLNEIKASLKQAVHGYLPQHQASFLAMKVSAANASNIFYTLLDKTKRASKIRSISTNYLPQDSFLESTGES